MFKFKLCNNGYKEFPFLSQIFFFHHVKIMLKNHIHHDLNSFKSKGCQCLNSKNLISPSSLINQWSIDLTTFFNGICCQILDRMKWMTIMWMQMSINNVFHYKKKYPIAFPFFANKALGESHSSLNYFWKWNEWRSLMNY